MEISSPAALGGPVQAVEPLTHNRGNAATGGIWRVRGPSGTAILKIARPPSREPVGSPAWQTSEESAHWNSWKREWTAYRTGFAAEVYADAGIVAPTLLRSEERADGSVALWLADASGVPGPGWPVERLAAFARQLGVAQARWVDRVPDDPWLSRRWLAQYLADRGVPEQIPWDLPAARLWPERVRESLRRLWERRDAFVASAEAGPRTLCHLDVWPMNLVEAGEETVLLDWAFVGEGAVGEDIGNLIPDSVADGLIDPGLLPEIDREVTAGYLAGLRDGGWTGPEESVRRAIHAAGAAKYSWLAPAMLARAAGSAAAGDANYGRPGSVPEVFARRAGLLSLLADWAETFGP